MRDEREVEELEGVVLKAAPREPSDAVLAQVRGKATATAETDGRRARERGARWFGAWRPAVAIGLVAVVAAVAFAVVGHQRSANAFAKENALAAITPRAGYVIHAKTTEWAQNFGEAAPVADGKDVTEFWLDLAGDRGRYITRAPDGSVRSEFVLDGHRFRLRGVNPVYPEQGTMVGETYGSNAAGGALQPYEYVRSALPEGQDVKTITLNGEPYWDVRWKNVKDSGGMTLTAHAQFRKSDYAPALIETTFPGGSTGAWTVMLWELAPISSLPTDTFSLSAIPTVPGVAEERGWHAKDLSGHVNYPVYWAGAKVDTATVVMGPESSASNAKEVPLFVEQLGFRSKVHEVLGESCTLAEYTSDDPKPSLSVFSGLPMSRGALAAKLRALGPIGAAAPVSSPIGPGESVVLDDGSMVAGFALRDATVLVHTGSSTAFADAVASLERVR